MDERISVIIPVYNVEKYLTRCVNSLLNQTYRNIEIILVNDGSSDDSLEICRKLAEKDTRVIVLNQENQGQSIARNEAMKAAAGKYFCFVDSDDYVAPNYIEVLYNLLSENDADISFCRFSEFYGERINISNNNEFKTKIQQLSRKEMLINMHNPNDRLYVFVWGKLFKRELFNDTIFPPGRICEDLAILYKLYDRSKKSVITNEVLYYYFRDNENSSTFVLKHKFYEDVAYVLEEKMTYMKEKGYEDILPYVRKTYMYWMLDYYRKLSKTSDKKRKKEVLKKYRELYLSNKEFISEKMYKLFYYFPEIYIKLKK